MLTVVDVKVFPMCSVDVMNELQFAFG